MKQFEFSPFLIQILHIICSEVPTSDEVEAYKCLQECLELRKRYVFQETVAPWEKEVISDPSTPKPNPEPFAHYPQGKTDVSLYSFSVMEHHALMNLTSLILFLQHYFEMQDGVVHVFPNKDGKSLSIGILMHYFVLYSQKLIWLYSFAFQINDRCSVLLFPAKEELFPVADATAFFTDLHHVLKVIAAGNIRTLCHRRLVLLEQARVLFKEE